MSENDIGKLGDGTSYEAVVRQHEQTINNSFTIDSTNNAMSAGAVTIATGVTVSVSGTWVVV
tara:strand:- start:109 stop:294 length:186 start_codon:yes stop_codon:yes gene_type:complete